LGVRFSALLALTTKVRQTTPHNITDIMAVVAADIMDMDKAECSISRILLVRHPRYPDNNNYTVAGRACPHRSVCLARRSLGEGGSLAFTFAEELADYSGS
jgi:hypothetical protein